MKKTLSKPLKSSANSVGWIAAIVGVVAPAIALLFRSNSKPVGDLIFVVLMLAPVAWGQRKLNRVAATFQLFLYLSVSLLCFSESYVRTSTAFLGLSVFQGFFVEMVFRYRLAHPPAALTKTIFTELSRGAANALKFIFFSLSAFGWLLSSAVLLDYAFHSAKSQSVNAPNADPEVYKASETLNERRTDFETVEYIRRNEFGCYIGVSAGRLPDDVIERARFASEIFAFPESNATALTFVGKFIEHDAHSESDLILAGEIYEKASTLEPTALVALIAWGDLETNRLDFERAIVPLSRALAAFPDDKNVHLALAKYHYAREDYNEALDEFLRVSKRDPNLPELLYYAGMIRRIFKKDEKMGVLLEKAYQLDSRMERAYIENARQMAERYDSDYLADVIETKIATEPAKASLFNWAIGEGHAVAKRYEKALIYLHRAIELGGPNTEIEMTIAECLAADGKLPEAITEFLKIDAEVPLKKNARLRAAELLLQRKEYDAASSLVEALVRDRPRYPNAYGLLARIAAARGDKKSAAEALRIEARNNPANLEVALNLAQALIDYKEYGEATRELAMIEKPTETGEVSRLSGVRARGFELLTRAYRLSANWDKATAAVVQGLEIDPESPNLKVELLRTLDRDSSSEMLSASTSTPPNPPARPILSVRKKGKAGAIFSLAHSVYKKRVRSK